MNHKLEDKSVLNMFRIRKTVLQMLRDRGYIVLETNDDLGMNRQEFERKFIKNYKIVRKDLEIKRPMWNLPDMKVLVIFVEGEKEKSAIGVKSIREYCERIKQDNFRMSFLQFQLKFCLVFQLVHIAHIN